MSCQRSKRSTCPIPDPSYLTWSRQMLSVPSDDNLAFDDIDREINLINSLLPLADIGGLRQNTEVALLSGEISNLHLHSLDQLFHNILNHWTNPLRRQNINQKQLQLFRWLLMSHSDISVWNRFVIDIAEQYVGPTARAHSQEFIAQATQDGTQDARDDIRYLIDITTQNIAFERVGGPLIFNERRSSQRTAILQKVDGVSNFTARTERRTRVRPGCLLIQLEEALEEFDRDVQERDRAVRERSEHLRKCRERYFKAPRDRSQAADETPRQQADRHTSSSESKCTISTSTSSSRREQDTTEDRQSDQTQRIKDVKLEENIARVSETIQTATELLQVLLAQRDRRQHNSRRYLHPQPDCSEVDPSDKASSTASVVSLYEQRPCQNRQTSSDHSNTDAYREMLETQRQIHYQLLGTHVGLPTAQATSSELQKGHRYDDVPRDYGEADSFIAGLERDRIEREQLRHNPDVPSTSPNSSTSTAHNQDSDVETYTRFERSKVSDMRSFGSGSTVKGIATSSNLSEGTRSLSRGSSILYDLDNEKISDEKISYFAASW